jgi:hypothetical protein
LKNENYLSQNKNRMQEKRNTQIDEDLVILNDLNYSNYHIQNLQIQSSLDNNSLNMSEFD